MRSAESWITAIQKAETVFKPEFDRMRSCEQVVETGHGEKHDSAVYKALRAKFGDYHLAYLQTYLEVMASSLYAKNPELKYERVKRIEHEVWDGEPNSMMDALAAVEQAVTMGVPPGPMALQIIQDINYVKEINEIIDKQGETMTLLAKSYMSAPLSDFKQSFNEAIKKTGVHGLHYVAPRYIDENVDQHLFNLPDSVVSLSRSIEAAKYEMRKTSTTMDRKKELERRIILLEGAKNYCRNKANVGVYFDFRRADGILFDPSCTCIDGFVGASWVAVRHEVTKQKLQDRFPALDCTKLSPATNNPKNQDEKFVTVWEVFDRDSQATFLISKEYDGGRNFITEPKPVETYIPEFFLYTAISWRTRTDSKKIFPLSDIELAASSQAEADIIKTVYIASTLLNIPRFLSKRGVMDPKDKQRMSQFDPLGVVEVGNLAMDALKTQDLFQTIKMGSDDERSYNPQLARNQINQILGVSDSAYGEVSGESATAVAQAADGTAGLFAYKRDQIDTRLANVARITGTVMLQKVPVQEVLRRVGNGMMWLTPDQVDFTVELILIAVAGSSARNNATDILQKVERIANILIQLPNFNPDWFLTIIAEAFDRPKEELIAMGMPSVLAMNAMKSKMVTAAEIAQAPAGAGGRAPQNAQAPTNALPQYTAPMEAQELANVQ